MDTYTGKADPYLVLTVGSIKLRTSVQKNTLAPVSKAPLEGGGGGAGGEGDGGGYVYIHVCAFVCVCACVCVCVCVENEAVSISTIRLSFDESALNPKPQTLNPKP